MLQTPVLLIIFNRPETTKQVFEAIRKAKPKQLFVAADGPRPYKVGEKERCQEARDIATSVDWGCEVKTLFRDENIGCGLGPFEAISWFFENVEDGIILEDDCWPDSSFFPFCDNLLKRYKHDKNIMHIGGNCFYPNKYKASYYFSAYPHIWGWASWRRAWEKYSFNMENIDEERLEAKLKDIFLSNAERIFWIDNFKRVASMSGKDFWDYQWCFALWNNDGIAILPTKNLIRNIGFGENATHTFSTDSPEANLKTYALDKIIYNDSKERDVKADYYTSRYVFHIQSKKDALYRKLKNRLISLLQK